MLCISFLYELLLTVAEVANTPILPFFVVFTAALDAGVTTSINGTGSFGGKVFDTELTVPQAAIIILTPCDKRNLSSSAAYLATVSTLFIP